MTTEIQHEPGPVDSLIADCRIARKRLKETPPEDLEAVVGELRNNVYPMIMAVLEQVAEVDEVIQEVIDQHDSFIQRDLAAQILQTVAVGGALAEEVKTLLPTLDDDLKKKKFVDLIKAFEHSAELTVMGVADAADEDEDEDEDEDDNEEKVETEVVAPIVAAAPAEVEGKTNV